MRLLTAIQTNGDIYYELGDAKGKIQNHNVLSALNHPILTAIDDANDGDSLTLVSADVYDSENTIYEYIVEVSDKSMFMLNMPKDYADADTLLSPLVQTSQYLRSASLRTGAKPRAIKLA